MNETWKYIKDYPPYMVSNCGNVRNDLTGNILIGGFDKDGYRQVTLCVNGKQYCRRVCRLVAIAFIDNPENLLCVNHKDENKKNDNVENLEWCTFQYNNIYGKRLFYTRKKVICVETNEIFNGVREAERAYGMPHKLSKIIKNDETIFGYHWKFLEENN